MNIRDNFNLAAFVDSTLRPEEVKKLKNVLTKLVEMNEIKQYQVNLVLMDMVTNR